MRRRMDSVDREDKRAWGRARIDPLAPTPPTRAAYHYYLGDPPRLRAGDRDDARVFLRKIEAVLAMYGWTNSEQAKLRRMRKKWQRRADGLDARFEAAGNMEGGPLPQDSPHFRLQTLHQARIDILWEIERSERSSESVP